LPLFLLASLGYYIFSQYNLFGNIVQLLLLSVASCCTLQYAYCVYLYIFIHVVLYVYDYFYIFRSMECEKKNHCSITRMSNDPCQQSNTFLWLSRCT